MSQRKWLYSCTMRIFKLTIIVLIVFSTINQAFAISHADLKIWLATKECKDAHKVRYVAGDPDDGSYTTINSIPGYDSIALYVTPKYRTTMLNGANEKTLKEIQKLKDQITKELAKGKDLSKLQTKLSEAEKNLYIVPAWDNGENLMVVLIPGVSERFTLSAPPASYLSAAKPVRHSVLDNKRQLVCESLSPQIKTFSEEDKQYLKGVYSITFNKGENYGYIVKYDKDCFLSAAAFQERIDYKSAKYNNFFTHFYGISTKTKDAIKLDY